MYLHFQDKSNVSLRGRFFSYLPGRINLKREERKKKKEGEKKKRGERKKKEKRGGREEKRGRVSTLLRW